MPSHNPETLLWNPYFLGYYDGHYHGCPMPRGARARIQAVHRVLRKDPYMCRRTPQRPGPGVRIETRSPDRARGAITSVQTHGPHRYIITTNTPDHHSPKPRKHHHAHHPWVAACQAVRLHLFHPA